ncbi:MAG: allantoicase, partial [Ignavibacteria bacterium]
MEKIESASSFSGLIDLAAEKFGGKAVLASDEFFAPKENLLKEGRGIFIPDKFTENGKWMDGWESRRKRTGGHDWCIIKLGVKGIIKGVDIDTNHFLGNHPPYASIEACLVIEEPDTDEFLSNNINWITILPKSPLNPGSQNLFPINTSGNFTHLKLNIYPDGGVARFRIFGEIIPEWKLSKNGELIDLAALINGGRV